MTLTQLKKKLHLQIIKGSFLSDDDKWPIAYFVMTKVLVID